MTHNSVFVGTQTRDVFCFLAQNSSVVSDEACGSLEKPASTQKCNTQACEAKYELKLIAHGDSQLFITL